MAGRSLPLSLRALSFDLDGTLLDTLPDIAASVNRTLEAFGRPSLPLALIGTMVGDGARTLLARALGQGGAGPGAGPGDPALDFFLRDYLRHCLAETRPYPGVRETLERLGDYRLIIVTNKPRLQVDRMLDGLALRNYFALVITPDECPERKPDPAPFRMALARLALAPGEMAHIGDSPCDILGGKAAGLLTVGVTYGIGAAEEVRAAGPDYLLARFEELAPWLGK